MRTTLLHDRAVKLSKASVHVHSDSVHCLGNTHAHPHSIEVWTQKIEWFTKRHEYRELDRIDGEPVEFEWNIFPGHTTLQLLREIQKAMTENRIRNSEIEASSCRWTTTSSGRKMQTNKCVFRFFFDFRLMQTDFRPKGHGSFPGPASEEKWHGAHAYKPE